jgi:hypothetical protein
MKKTELKRYSRTKPFSSLSPPIPDPGLIHKHNGIPGASTGSDYLLFFLFIQFFVLQIFYRLWVEDANLGPDTHLVLTNCYYKFI